MYNVGLIGHGAFGKLLEHHLANYCNFTVFDPTDAPDTLAQTLACPIIVFALPVQALEPFLQEQQASFSPDALYLDVCSVKVMPVAAMRSYLPPTASIIATHPLFGPATARDAFAGQRIMTYPVRVSDQTYAAFTAFLQELQLQIIEVTPEEHDQAMAYVQGLSHYIGRAMQYMNIPNTELATQAYEDLEGMKNVQGNDSDELFSAIMHMNPYSKDIHTAFGKALEAVNKKFDL